MLALSLVATLLLMVGCGGDDSGEKEGSDETSTVSYVGEIAEANSFVALIVSETREGEEREVSAYLCDGNLVNDWFWGSTSGDTFDLTSGNETRLEGQLDGDTTTGTITSSEGDSISFQALPATGVAGLYEVTLDSEGTLSGTSERGGQVEGEVGDQLEDGSYPVSGTFTPFDNGQPQDFEAFIDDDTPRDLRWIVLPDGQVRGGPFGGQGGGFNFQGGGFNFQGGGFNLQGGGNFQGGGFNFQGGGFNFQGGSFNLQGGGRPAGSSDAAGGDVEDGGSGNAPGEAEAGGQTGEDNATSGGLNFASSGAGGTDESGGKGKDDKGKGGGGKGDKGKGGGKDKNN